ncbi:unnamed protein product [Rangifer tarandus platyrhynchus]|uniref:Uncharacterized protein n=1 Tax=Rangifer tarandus platyrhynchus TaxID=3082113 RepID=A0AC59Z6U7_RANTA
MNLKFKIYELKNSFISKLCCHIIQQSHSWAHIWKIYNLKRYTHAPTFIAALFIIAKTWKQPKGPSTDEWIKTLYMCISLCVLMETYVLAVHLFLLLYMTKM